MKIGKFLTTNLFSKPLIAAAALALIQAPSALATIFYVSPLGSDSNNGSPSHPLATLTKALTLATTSGDQIQLDAGTYNIADNIAGYEDGNVYAAVILLSSANNGIKIMSNPTNATVPILNFSAISPSNYRVAGIWIPTVILWTTTPTERPMEHQRINGHPTEAPTRNGRLHRNNRS